MLRVVKHQPGHLKMHYRGLKENSAQLATQFTWSNSRTVRASRSSRAGDPIRKRRTWLRKSAISGDALGLLRILQFGRGIDVSQEIIQDMNTSDLRRVMPS